MSKFKQDYVKAETWAGMEKAIKLHLTHADAQALVDAMEIVKHYTGLDMRQDWLKNLLKSMMTHNSSFK